MSLGFNPADLLKTHVLLNMVGPNAPLQSLFLYQAWEGLVQHAPKLIPKLNAWCCSRRNKSMSSIVPKPTAEVSATISCERTFHSSSSTSRQSNNALGNHSRMDSVIHYITTLPAVKNLLSITHHDYMPHDFDAILIDNDIYFELQELKHNDGQVEIVKFKLFCYDHSIQHLQQFVEKCNTEYERRMANKLGTSLYFFDMMTQSKNKRSTQNPLPTSHLLYTRHKFHTTRTFDNVFFEQKDAVQNHTEFFLNRKDWYEKKGIPYTLGFMFHGPPGCGKTSTIKAIANISHRHILNIQLSQIKSKDQLRHLFFNDEIHVYDGFKTEKFTIPVHERLYVIEDIDAMGDAVLRREWRKPTADTVKKREPLDPWEKEEEEAEPIDLSFLLNLLDGTLEASGRIIAISSNFPERIDRALIRPGRIDMIVHFKKCNSTILKAMVNSFYDKEFGEWTNTNLDYKWSPAEVNQILFRNFKTPETAIEELKTLTAAELSGISD